MEADAQGDVQSPIGVRPAAVRFPQRGGSDAGQHEGPNLDSRLALAEGEGVTFEDCLNLALRILPLLPQIPVDVSYETQIPLIIAYCPESSVYRRWHAKHGRVSPFCKEVRASQTLTKVRGAGSCSVSRCL